MPSRSTRESGIGVAGEIFDILTRPALAWILAVFPFLFCLLVSEWLSEEKIFILLTLFIIGFGITGAAWFYGVHGKGFLLNPLILSSFFTFIVGFGISNYVLIMEVDQVDYYLGTDAYHYLNKTMILASIAIVSLWAGYRSRVGAWLANKWSSTVIAKRFFRKEYRPDYRIIAVIFVLSLACRLLQIRLGVFGYSAEIDRLAQLVSYTQWLALGVNIGFLALLVVSLTWFHGSTDRRALYLMVAFLIYETIFGLLSGFKGAVVMPLVLTGVVYYYTTDRFPWKSFFAAIALLFLAYAVIEPFRALRYDDPDFKNRDIMAIASGVMSAGESYDRPQVETVYRTAIARRVNSTLMASCAVKYMDENGLPEEAKDFLQNLFLVPMQALVPRILWPTKPNENIGGWFNVVVLGGSFISAAAMTPIGYLYFTGGVLAVVIGFFFIGIAQRWVASSFWKCGSGSTIVYFGLLGNIAIIDSSVNGIFIVLIRYLLLLVLVQYFLFKK